MRAKAISMTFLACRGGKLRRIFMGLRVRASRHGWDPEWHIRGMREEIPRYHHHLRDHAEDVEVDAEGEQEAGRSARPWLQMWTRSLTPTVAGLRPAVAYTRRG